MVRITRDVLGRILELCKSAYPYEVNGLLLGRKIVDDFVLMPSEYGHTHVMTRMHDLPIYPTSSGTFHSHPSPNNMPSRADLNFFSKFGRNHLIIGYPYSAADVAAYDSTGKRSDMEVV